MGWEDKELVWLNDRYQRLNKAAFAISEATTIDSIDINRIPTDFLFMDEKLFEIVVEIKDFMEKNHILRARFGGIEFTDGEDKDYVHPVIG